MERQLQQQQQQQQPRQRPLIDVLCRALTIHGQLADCIDQEICVGSTRLTVSELIDSAAMICF